MVGNESSAEESERSKSDYAVSAVVFSMIQSRIGVGDQFLCGRGNWNGRNARADGDLSPVKLEVGSFDVAAHQKTRFFDHAPV